MTHDFTQHLIDPFEDDRKIKEQRLIEQMQTLVGEPYTASVKERIMQITGFRSEDIVAPGEGGRKAYQVYVEADANNQITGFNFSG